MIICSQIDLKCPKRVDMKRYSVLPGIVVAAMACSNLPAQEKPAVQPNARVGQVTDNIVYLSHLTGAEFFDAFVDVKDISAVVIRAAGR